METFAEVRNHIMERYELTIDEPFIISFEFAMDNSNRRQSIFLAELEATASAMTVTSRRCAAISGA